MTKAYVFLQPGWADWEAGPALAGLREYLGAQVAVATPDGQTVASIGGVQALADLSFAEVELEPDVLLILAGSEEWTTYRDDDLDPLLRSAAGQGIGIAGICAGTLALARAGLFEGRAHTSNGRDFIDHHAPGYVGRDGYSDVPHAVSDRRVVSAPGSAPNTFAAAVFRLLGPQGETVAAQYEGMARAEWG